MQLSGRRVRPLHALGRARWRKVQCRTFITPPLVPELKNRGLVSQVTREDKLQKIVEHRPKKAVYAGIDPTAKALHVGHLIPLMCLLHFQIRGHPVISLIGGATGLVGDPSGRSQERQFAEEQKVENNVQRLEGSIKSFFSSASQYALARIPPSSKAFHDIYIRNNIEWHKNFGLLEFLRTVGVHARINTMLARDSVQLRLKASEGLSFAEFTYQLLQGYDFFHLYKNSECHIQVGGSDQWGNILAGVDLINKDQEHSEEKSELGAVGLTTPLLTTASGDKFGKSAGNAVWLDSKLTSIFDFYQFFLRTPDADCEKHLKMFTLLSLERIQDIVKNHSKAPEKRVAQRLLADEVTLMVHGKAGLRKAHSATELLFDPNLLGRAQDIIDALSGDPRLVFVDKDDLLNTAIFKLAVQNGLCTSSSAARTLIKAKGFSVNNKRMSDQYAKLSREDLIDGKIVILRAGKERHLVLALT
ncbi:hypothetical protein JAAARDRAFT_156185 [Jaapia argillacea MUCL 33604]|uniref:Tyrosine--tRNA ligase n=1 Tax=Jaapia argillacea MUCL 33604 TaxID=933084 RepID=A0A067PRW9_9AGAM|nr:hypothetical protein JAAARDRAFT_156185 [Jaapia argillacea MUCL 33604]